MDLECYNFLTILLWRRYMDINEYVRFALFVGDGEQKTFEKNLEKIAKLIFYRHEEIGRGINVREFSQYLKNDYFIDATFDEIVQVLTNAMDEDKTKVFYKFEGTFNQEVADKKFSLILDKRDQIKKEISEKGMKSIVDSFVMQNSENLKDANNSDIEQLIYTYLYHIFNRDAEAVFELLNQPKKISVVSEEETVFSPEDRVILNLFFSGKITRKTIYYIN